MEKRRIRVLGVMVFIGIMWIHAGRGFVPGEEESQNVGKVQFQGTEIVSDADITGGTESLGNTEAIQEMETEYELPYNDFQFLREALSDKEFYEMGWELVTRGICDYSEEVKGEFVPEVPDNCSYPEELVVMMEEIFYQCANTQLRMENYDERLKELGADEFVVGLEEVYQLFPKVSDHREEIENVYDAYEWVVRLYIEEEWDTLQHCLVIFHFCPAKGQDNYIFLYMQEGTGKFIYPYFMQRNGDSFTEIETVSLPSDGEAKIMQYGENFYYVSPERNECLDDFDGIRIYNLADDLWKKCLIIRYLPEEYVWSDLYRFRDMDDKAQEEMDLYLEKIKEEFASGNYLGNGIRVYCGDERNGVPITIQAPGLQEGCMAYPVDAANCGEPVYVWKDLGHWEFDYLDVSFFRNPSEKIFSADYSSALVQMWFKEICGKTYTFRVFHISDYNYIFNVLLLEDGKPTVVRTAMIAPRRKFVVKETDGRW